MEGFFTKDERCSLPSLCRAPVRQRRVKIVCLVGRIAHEAFGRMVVYSPHQRKTVYYHYDNHAYIFRECKKQLAEVITFNRGALDFSLKMRGVRCLHCAVHSPARLAWQGVRATSALSARLMLPPRPINCLCLAIQRGHFVESSHKLGHIIAPHRGDIGRHYAAGTRKRRQQHGKNHIAVRLHAATKRRSSGYGRKHGIESACMPSSRNLRICP